MRIDFYLYDPHEIYVWEELAAALGRLHVDARFVLEPPGVHTALGSRPDPAAGYRDVKDQDLVALMSSEVHGETRRLLAERGIDPLERGRHERAQAVVTTQGVGWLWRYRGLRLKTAYGCAANRDIYGHSQMNRGLDGVFVQGEYSRQCIARWVPAEDVIVAGYPKLDRLLGGGVERSAWAKRFGLDPGRPTAVFLPTWAHNSSLERFGPAVAALAGRCNVLCKPHHNNLRFEAERLRPLAAAPGVRIETEERDIVPFLAVADLVLADVRSGALTEALLAGRPAVGLSASGDPAVDNLLEGSEEAVAVCRDPAGLAALARAALAGEEGRQQACEDLVARLFTTTRGRDAEWTAAEMKKLVRRKQAAAARERRHHPLSTVDC